MPNNLANKEREGPMAPDVWVFYQQMLQCRLFEEAIAKLWHDGQISGEMHLGTGEEAIMVGILAHLKDGDAMALDHRGTSALLLRGIEPSLLINEMLGNQHGLCAGMGGHMHLFSKEHLAASSGIVGASGPTAAGFGLAAQLLNPGAISIAFFGDGSINQGMLMESMNLAVAWNLPVIFVCKDDGWAITTQSSRMTGGNISKRAEGLGLPVYQTDGQDVLKVWESAKEAIDMARSGQGPSFLHATCIHLEAHFLGFQLTRMVRDPLHEMPNVAMPLVRSFLKWDGSGFVQRLAGVKAVLGAVLSTLKDPRRDRSEDPLVRLRTQLEAQSQRLEEIEERVTREIQERVEAALAEGAA